MGTYLKFIIMETKFRTKIDAYLDGFTVEVSNLIMDLVDEKDFRKKVSAKKSLIYLGNSILPQINTLLNSENYKLRLLAAKLLQQIKSEESIDTLITLLRDKDSSIRWIAAKGLVGVGRAAIVPLLKNIIKMGSSYNLRWGAHYVLVNLFNEIEKDQYKTLILSLSKNNIIGFIAPCEAANALRIYKNAHRPQIEQK
jgi:HEAT repeat protein